MGSRQALLFDADRDSLRDDDSESSDTIEMSGLEEVPVTPARRSNYDATRYHSGSTDSDDDSDVEDGEALLGPRSRTRGRERSEEHPTNTNTFGQVKRIVLEVSPDVHSVIPLVMEFIDSTHAVADDSWHTLHRGAFGNSVGEFVHHARELFTSPDIQFSIGKP